MAEEEPETVTEFPIITDSEASGASRRLLPGTSFPKGREFGRRYARQGVLGRGGMGEVGEYADDVIGRRVALKVALTSPEETREEPLRRFVREARLQGQLQHPAIVPVYDLARDDEGRFFFTMQRVDGVTLKKVLAGLREGDREISGRFTQRKLLTAFVTVCQALDYAHSRGVVHRDVKPANVMLGRFGEVYLLDWGIAKLADAPDPLVEGVEGGEPSLTQAGMFLGTAGYASPEQIDAEGVDGRADVYALGAVLFEILTLRALNSGDTAQRVLRTIDGVDARASERAPDREVAPELEAACVRATQLDPDARFASARELHQAVDAFLDGNRDMELRRGLAKAHAERAREVGARAVSESADVELRREALEDVGRALALDPDNAVALLVMRDIMENPPSEAPEVVETALVDADTREMSWGGGSAAAIFASTICFLPALVWLGVRDWVPVVAMHALFIMAAVFGALAARSGRLSLGLSSYCIGQLATAFSSAFFGVFVLVPMLAVVNAMAFSLAMPRRARPLIAAVGLLTVLGPLSLELSGVLDASYVFSEGAVTILPRALALPAFPTIFLLAAASTAPVVMAVLSVSRQRAELAGARRELLMQGWYLRALFPGPTSG